MGTKCPNKDCEYHGIEVCMLTRLNKDRVLVECEAGGLRCLRYTPRITCKDLDAPFNSNCIRKAGRYHNVR